MCITFGGFQRSVTVEWMARYFNRDRIRPHWIFQAASPPASVEVIRSVGDPVSVLPPVTPRGALRSVRSLREVLRRIRPVAVHAHQLPDTAGVLTAALLAGVGRRVFTRMYATLHHDGSPKGLIYDRCVNALATRIVATCDNVRWTLEALDRVRSEKIRVVNYGVRVPDFERVSERRVRAVADRWGIPDGRTVVGMISRFERKKGIQYVIPAIARLHRRFPRVLLLLANAVGPDTDGIRKALRAALPADAWRAVPFEPDVAALYASMDVFVHVPVDRRYEAFGQVYLESMAAGLPSVLTLSGIAPEYVRDGDTACVVPFRDALAIEAALARLLEDLGEAKRMGHRARERVRALFPVERMTRALEDVYLGSDRR